MLLVPLTLNAQEGTKPQEGTTLVSLDNAIAGLYPIAAGNCDLEVGNLKLEHEPCDLARRQGDEEHVYLLTSDKAGQPVLVIEGTMSDTNPHWKLIYRKGEQST